ncbi:putative DNA-binding domain-containing protein [Enterobacteriaceae bacterium LUAb1]
MNVPHSLLDNTERLTQQIRAESHAAFSAGVICYRNLIRNNIDEVFSCAFPLACRQLTLPQKRSLISRFLTAHRAEEPEYHHIATELLRFIQQLPDIPSVLVAVMEYEWVLFCVEISAEKVSLPPADKLTHSKKALSVTLNPTLVAIELPFNLDNAEENIISDGNYAYAVYRKFNYDICYKALTLVDQYLIQTLNNQRMIPISALRETCASQLADNVLDEWLLHSATSELIDILEKE